VAAGLATAARSFSGLSELSGPVISRFLAAAFCCGLEEIGTAISPEQKFHAQESNTACNGDGAVDIYGP
jgi:hypothetical protein